MLRSCTVRSLTRLPSMKMSPEVGTSKPAISRNTVVFPLPLGPSKPSSSPSFTTNETLPTAVPEPNFLVSPRTSIFTGLLRSRFRDGRFSPGLGDFQHGEDREGDGEQSQGHGIGRHVIKIDITLIDMQGRGLRQQQDIAGHD